MKVNIGDCGVDIRERLLKGVDVVKEERKIKGLESFRKEFGLKYGKMNSVKDKRDKGSFGIEYVG